VLGNCRGLVASLDIPRHGVLRAPAAIRCSPVVCPPNADCGGPFHTSNRGGSCVRRQILLSFSKGKEVNLFCVVGPQGLRVQSSPSSVLEAHCRRCRVARRAHIGFANGAAERRETLAVLTQCTFRTSATLFFSRCKSVIARSRPHIISSAAVRARTSTMTVGGLGWCGFTNSIRRRKILPTVAAQSRRSRCFVVALFEMPPRSNGAQMSAMDVRQPSMTR